MVIGERLRKLREEKNLSQGHVEQRTGLLRCYVSRVENGHTVPSIETLEKFARALETPMYRLFYEGDARPTGMHIASSKNSEDKLWGSTGADAKTLRKFYKLIEKMSDQDRGVLLHMAQQMQKR